MRLGSPRSSAGNTAALGISSRMSATDATSPQAAAERRRAAHEREWPWDQTRRVEEAIAVDDDELGAGSRPCSGVSLVERATST